MLPSQENRVIGGMSSDGAPEKLSPSSYVYAQNMQINNREGYEVDFGGIEQLSGRDFKLTSVRGNSNYFSLPAIGASSYVEIVVPEVYSLTSPQTLVLGFSSLTIPALGNLTVSGVFPTPLLTIYNYLVSNAGTYFDISVTYNIFTSLYSGKIILKPKPAHLGTAIIDSISQTGTRANTGDVVTTITQYAAISNYDIVGYACSASTLALITTAPTNDYPSTPPNTNQIWDIPISQYDDIAAPSIVSNLKYIGNLGYCLRYQADCRLIEESDCIKRLIITDDLNPIRFFNIADAFSVANEGIYDLIPRSDILRPSIYARGTPFPVPVLPGGLKTGIYRYTARYITFDGKTSGFFPLSQFHPVFVGENYINATSDNVGQQSSIAMNIRVANIDKSFKSIELVALYYTTETDPPTSIQVVKNIDISSIGLNSEIQILHSNNFSDVSASVLSIADFNNLYPFSVTKAKNIEIEDSRLIVSNFQTNEILAFSASGVTPSSITKQIPYIPDPIPATFGSIDTNYKYLNIQNNVYDRGYFRAEKYRFGIVFLLKDNTWSYVYDLGDYTTDSIIASPLFTNADQFDLNVLGVRFSTIDLFAIKDSIKGYKIVRAPRVKSILAQGLFADNVKQCFDTGTGLYITPVFERYFFTPESDLNGDSIVFQTGMTLDCVASYLEAGLGNLYTRPPAVAPGDIPFSWDVSSLSLSTQQVGNGETASPLILTGIKMDVLNSTFPLVQPITTDGSGRRVYNIRIPHPGYGPFQSLSFVDTGHFQPVDAFNSGATPGTYIYNSDVYGGDCIPSVHFRLYASATLSPSPAVPPDNIRFIGAVAAAVVETTVNADLRYIGNPATETAFLKSSKVFASLSNGAGTPRVVESFNYDKVYSYEENTQFFVAQPAFIDDCNNKYPTRIIASQKHQFGQTLNGYSRLLADEFIDANPQYGPINGLLNLKGDNAKTLYFWQSQAFGILPVGEYRLTQGDVIQINIGSGNFFGAYNYISREVGSFHKQSIFKGKNRFYFFDNNSRSIYRFAQDGLTNLSTQAGMSNFIFNRTIGISTLDNPVFLGGIHGVYDDNRDEALFTMTIVPNINSVANSEDQIPSGLVAGIVPFSLVFSEKSSKFVSALTCIPQLYIKLPGARIVTQQPYTADNDLWLHYANATQGAFYGASPDDSYLIYVVNAGDGVSKTLSNLIIDSSRAPTLVGIQNYQTSDAWNGNRLLRGQIDLSNPAIGGKFVQARGSKWLLPVPFATDINLGAGWVNGQLITRLVGEVMFVKLVWGGGSFVDLESIASYFSPSLRNT